MKRLITLLIIFALNSAARACPPSPSETEQAFWRTFSGANLFEFQAHLLAKIAADYTVALTRLIDEHALNTKVDGKFLDQFKTDPTNASLLYETQHELELRRATHSARLASALQLTMEQMVGPRALEESHLLAEHSVLFRGGTYHAQVRVQSWRVIPKASFLFFTKLTTSDELETTLDVSAEALSVCTRVPEPIAAEYPTDFCSQISLPERAQSTFLRQGATRSTVTNCHEQP